MLFMRFDLISRFFANPSQFFGKSARKVCALTHNKREDIYHRTGVFPKRRVTGHRKGKYRQQVHHEIPELRSGRPGACTRAIFRENGSAPPVVPAMVECTGRHQVFTAFIGTAGLCPDKRCCRSRTTEDKRSDDYCFLRPTARNNTEQGQRPR